MKKKNLLLFKVLTKFLIVGILTQMTCFGSLWADNSEGRQNQTRNISGKVVSEEDNEGLPGVNIIEKGTTNGTVTNVMGEYTLTVSENATLVFSSVGYLTQEVKVQGRSVIDLVMEPDVKQLEELVIIGYGEQKKESIVGSIVQTSGEDLIKSGGVSTVGQALTGRLPGVVAISSTGRPGSEAPDIFIRGRSTWNGGGQPLILVDGIERSMNDIDINDIQNISVLKDASATAVFGVKGANGVILINTKRGQKGKPQLEISANSTVKTPSKLPKKLDAYDAIGVVNEAILREVSIVPESWNDYTPEAIRHKYRFPENQFERERYPNVDWADVVMKDHAMDHRVNLSIRGGTDFAKYFGSLAYQHVGDIFNAEGFDNGRDYKTNYSYNRFNYRSNVDFDITPTTRFSVNLSGFYGIQNTNDGDMRLVYQSIYKMPPGLFYPMHEDGTYGIDANEEWDNTNPLYIMTTKGHVQNHRIQVNSDFILEQKLDFLLKGLKFKGSIAYDNNFEGNGGIKEENPGGIANVIFKRYLANGEEFYKTPTGKNQFDFVLYPWYYDPFDINNNELSRRLFYQLSLNFDRTFDDKHNVNVLALMNREEYSKGSMFPKYREDWVARVTYNFKDKYFLDVNGAYNGTEKFGPGYRFDLFPSLALGWMITEEPFMGSVKWLDMLKIRGSYGKVGDDEAGIRWGYISQWRSGGSAYMNPNNVWGGGARSPYIYYKEAAIGNPNLHWETSTKSNIGFELAALNNLFTATFDYFTENRNDIIVIGNDRSLPAFLGFNPPDQNVGETTVSGYEVTVGFNHYLNTDFKLWSSASYTKAKDKILFREEPKLLDTHLKTEGFAIDLPKSTINGEMMTNWDDVYMSVPLSNDQNYRRPGYYDMVDFNSDGIHNGNTDRAPYGYPDRPLNTWNWMGGIDYKKLSFMFQFYGAYNATRDYVVWDFHKNTAIYLAHLTNYWTVDNQNGDEILPSWKGGATTDAYRSRFDASYIRLKTVELAYTFDVKGTSTYRVFLNGNNLWLYSHLPDDREKNGQQSDSHVRGDYPTFRRFNVGVNINF